MEAVKAIQDESGDWYVIPAYMLDEFRADEEQEYMVLSGHFDAKWGNYRTGGDLNLKQLYAEL